MGGRSSALREAAAATEAYDGRVDAVRIELADVILSRNQASFHF